MASRRCISTLSRHFRSHLLSWRTATLIPPSPLRSPLPATRAFQCLNALPWSDTCHFSSRPTNSSDEDIDEEGEEEEDEEEEEVGEESWDPEDGDTSGSRRIFQTGKSDEEKAMEAAEIGYRVVGPLDPSENPFKPYKPVFAVVQIGSHQFKVSNGDSIFTERLKFCEVNDKLILNRVLMVGSKSQTIIGRPILPVAAVHAVVEEHALDAKVIIFKKKRRKNYRRTKGHRQELTKLRITGIQGIDGLESVPIAA